MKNRFFSLLFFLFDIHVRAAVISSDLNILHFHVYALHMQCVKAVSLKMSEKGGSTRSASCRFACIWLLFVHSAVFSLVGPRGSRFTCVGRPLMALMMTDDKCEEKPPM